MRGIERIVAAFLLAGAVAGAAALPRLAGGPDSAGPLGRFTSRATTVVDAAPLATAPKPKVVRAVVLLAAQTPVIVAAHPRITARPRPAQQAPHVPAVAPEPQITPAPPVVTPSTPPPATTAAATAPASATPIVSPTPASLPGLGLGHGKGHGKGQDKVAAGSTPIQLPQVQPQPQPTGNGNGNSNGNASSNGNGKSQGHGPDKGA